MSSVHVISWNEYQRQSGDNFSVKQKDSELRFNRKVFLITGIVAVVMGGLMFGLMAHKYAALGKALPAIHYGMTLGVPLSMGAMMLLVAGYAHYHLKYRCLTKEAWDKSVSKSP